MLREYEADRSGRNTLDTAADYIGEDLNRISRDALASLNTTIAEVVKASRLEREQARKEGEHVQRMLVVVGILCPVLALIGGVIMTLSIVRPLRKELEYSGSIAAGKLDAALDVVQKEEVGILAESLRSMVAMLNRTI